MPQSGARYMQIATHFRQLIDNQRLLEGDQLPTDEEVGRLFNVSRITARQAMSEHVDASLSFTALSGNGGDPFLTLRDRQLDL